MHRIFLIVTCLHALLSGLQPVYAQKTPPAPQACNCNGNINSVVHVTCNGGSNGSANASLNAIGVDCTIGDPDFFEWFNAGGSFSTNQSVSGLTAGTYTCIMQNDDCYLTRTVTINEPAAITGSISKTNETCNQNNGTATVSGVAGGTGSYTYSWTFNGNPTSGTTAAIIGLTQGNYACTVKDANNCSIVLSVTVGNSGSDPNGSISSSTNVSCFGGSNGSATASATGGGGAPYTYAWSPSGGNAATANNLGPGVYTCNITGSNGCTDPTPPTVTITQPSSAINIGSTGMSPVTCNGGSNGQASVSSISGGTGAYTYSWSPSGGNAATANGLTAGFYTCTVRDANNCSVVSPSIQVTQFSAVSGNATVNQHVSCFGGNNGSATVSSSGGNGSHTYSWSPSGGNAATANNLPAGTYACTVTDFNGCATIVSNIVINQPGSAVSANASSTPANCGTATGTASAGALGGTGSYTYQWSPSGGTGPTANNLFAGTYSVTVWDANGCSTTDVTIVGTTGSLSANASVLANVTCNGGSNGAASVTVSSGTPPYTYSWSPSGGASSAATGLSAGVKYVTVTDNAGCVSTKSVTITQPLAIAATVTSTAAACATANGTATANPSGGTGAFTYSWNTAPVQTTKTATGLLSGTYSVTVRDANNCSKTFTGTVGTAPSPSVTFSTTSVSCNGGNTGAVTATPIGGGGPPYTYVWNTSPAQSTPSVSGLLAGNYAVTVSTASCTNTATVSIAQPAVLSAAMTTTPTPCLQSVGSAKATVSGGTAPFTYAWTPTGQTTQTATGLTAGFYTVTVTDKNSCTKNFGTIVNSVGGPTVTPTPSPTSCFGTSDGAAIVTVNGVNPPYTYAWSPSGGTTSAASNLSAQIYSATVSDAAGCVTTATVLITEPTQVLPGLVKDSLTACLGYWALLGTNASGGSPGYSYNWLPAGSLDDGTLPNPAAAPSVMTIYTVTVTDGKGCTGTETATVFVAPLPVITVGAPSLTICNGGSATLSATGGVSYAWSPTAGLSNASISNPVASPTAATIYYVIGTDSAGCFNQDTVSIQFTPTPTVSITASSSTVCSGTSLTLNGTTNAQTYLWSSGQTTSSATVTPNATTTYTLTVSTGNCSKTSTVTITANPTPTATITGSSVLCIGSSQTLSAPSGNHSYLWSTGSSASAILIAPTINTVYTLTLTSTVNGSCKDTAVKSVTVASLPVVTTSATYTTICVGSSVDTLKATGGTQYAWSPGGGTTSAITVSFSTIGVKSFTVIVTNSSGCSAMGTLTVNATNGFPQPVVVPGSPWSYCVGDPIPTFTATPNPSTNGIGWTFNSTYTTGATFTPPQNLSPGTYPLNCVQGTGTSCLSNPTVVNIVIHPLPAVTASSDVTVCPGFSAQINASGGVSYAWIPASDLSNPSIANPAAEPQLTTNFVVTATDANSCRNKDSVTVYVVLNDTCIIQVYNLISPNGDDDNDVWWIDGIKFFPENSVRIFNRWGALVWKGAGYDNEEVVWRGDNENGGKLPVSTYYYIIDLGDRTITGFVELVQ